MDFIFMGFYRFQPPSSQTELLWVKHVLKTCDENMNITAMVLVLRFWRRGWRRFILEVRVSLAGAVSLNTLRKRFGSVRFGFCSSRSRSSCSVSYLLSMCYCFWTENLNFHAPRDQSLASELDIRIVQNTWDGFSSWLYPQNKVVGLSEGLPGSRGLAAWRASGGGFGWGLGFSIVFCLAFYQFLYVFICLFIFYIWLFIDLGNFIFLRSLGVGLASPMNLVFIYLYWFTYYLFVFQTFLLDYGSRGSWESWTSPHFG